MAIKIGSNFTFQGQQPNFERDRFATKAAMKAFPETSIDDGHLSYCAEDGNTYQFKSSNTVNTTTGRWRIFKTDIVVDASLNGSSKNPIQNKAVFDALKAKADTAALGAYQPKYKADYIAKADFNYSDLPASTNVVDLNGYTMSVSVDRTIVRGKYYNGIIGIDSNQVELSGVYSDNVRILSSAEGVDQCKIGEACNFRNSELTNVLITADCEFHNCNISSSVINSFLFIEFSVISECTFGTDIGNLARIRNSIIDNVTYHIAVIKNGKPTETGYESNIYIANAKLDNAPSCDAIIKALKSKVDTVALGNYISIAAAQDTYATKEKAFTKDTVSTEPGQVVAGPPTTQGNLYLRKLIADDIPDLKSKYQPKYAADYIATEDISTLPITNGVIDLNGNQIDLPNIDLVDGYLTIMNGTVVFNSTTTNLRVKELELSNVTISYSDDVNIVLDIKKLKCLNVVDYPGLRINFTEGSAIEQATLINSSIRTASLSVTKTLNMYNSTCNINGNVKLTAYNSFVCNDGLSLANGSAWYNTQLDISPYYTSGWIDEAGKMHCGMYFDDTITGDSDYAPQTKAVYNALQLKADKTQLNDLATKTDFVELRNKVNAMPKTVFITQAAYNALTTKDPNTIYYING